MATKLRSNRVLSQINELEDTLARLKVAVVKQRFSRYDEDHVVQVILDDIRDVREQLYRETYGKKIKSFS